MTPKSGDVELQVAPILDVANIASTAKLELGRYPVINEIISNVMLLFINSITNILKTSTTTCLNVTIKYNMLDNFDRARNFQKLYVLHIKI